ncbi:MAG: DoxX family protein [Parabacteroides sp.]|nr:DoxX family protein [Parabacteroides sp.]
MINKDSVIKIGVEFSRILIGVVFIFSGFVKAVDPMGGAIKIGEYLTSFGLEKLEPLSIVLSFNLSAIEFTLGVCMLLGAYRRYTAFWVLSFMSFMTLLTFYLALFDPVSDCGCFGDALILTNWETFFKNVLLLIAAVITYKYNQRLYPFYTYKVYWFVALYAYLLCFGFALYNYNHLPVIDFRPYKIGANIPQMLEIPEGAPMDEYKYTLIYEKEGVKKEFSLENYPENDTSWTFVETKAKLIKKGYQPLIRDFNLYDTKGVEVTEEIIHHPGLVFLLIAPNLEDADDDRMDAMSDVYDYALENGLLFYCVTSSSLETMAFWSDHTGAEYPFLIADEVMLKTIVRSNPGLMLLQNGTILEKWHSNDFPDEDTIDREMARCLDENYIKNEEDGFLISNLLTFAVPLLLVWMYDLIRNKRRRKKEEI